ncbi:unnamed protein product [Musa hybrid cultivar]
MITPMEVQVRSSAVLALGDPNTEPREVPLTIFDRFACDIHIAVLYAFTAPTPSNADIVEGLSETLAHFPMLAAQLGHDCGGRPCLMVGGGGGGVLVVEATVSSTLAEHMPLEPSPDLLLLHPRTEDAAHLLLVQLNRFRCGGLVVGLSAHHKVADGQSMSAFLVAWGQAVRGIPIDPLPLYDRSWLKPRVPPRCEFQHWGLDFMPITPRDDEFASHNNLVEPSRITNILLRYSSEFITGKLKAETKAKYTTFETLLAHVWRKITAARGLEGGEETTIRVTVNGRRRLKPPVSDHYFGNLVLNAYPRSTAEMLARGGLEEAAKVVHEAIARTSGDYVQSMVDLGDMYGDEELVPVYGTEGNVLSPLVDAESWLRLRFEDVDFGGGGKLCAFLPTWVALEGLVIFIPVVGEGGGVDVMVSLLREHAEVLKRISHSLH